MAKEERDPDTVLADLVQLRGPVDDVIDAAAELPWDDRPAITLRSADLRSVLRRFLDDELSVEQLWDWAGALLARDDVAYEKIGQEIELEDMVNSLGEVEFFSPENSQVAVTRSMLGRLEGTVGDPAMFPAGRDLASRLLAGSREFAPAWLEQRDRTSERFPIPPGANLAKLREVVSFSLLHWPGLICRTGDEHLDEPVIVQRFAMNELEGMSLDKDGDLLVTEPDLEHAILLTTEGYGILAGSRLGVAYMLGDDEQDDLEEEN